MNWEILGIEETKDKNEITRAYRERLAVTNPEDKPEEFMALRKAYEEALRFADEKEDKSDTPVKAWGKKMEELYNSFEKRNRLENWKELFSDPVCCSFDTRGQIEEELLNFLTCNNDLDKDIWKFFDEQFDFIARREELKETYPPQFIDYIVVLKAFSDEFLPAKLFSQGTDENACIEYTGWYWKVLYGHDKSGDCLKNMINSTETHPWGDALIIRRSDILPDEKISALKEIADKYPDEVPVIAALADTCREAGQYDACCQYCEAFLNDNPDCFTIREKYLAALIEKGDSGVMDKIIDIYDNTCLMKTERNALDNLYDKAAELSVNLLEEKRKEQTIRPDEMLLLAKFYSDKMEIDKIESILSVTDREADPYNWHRVKYALAAEKEDYAETIKHLDCALEYVKNSDMSIEKNRKRQHRIGCLLSMKAVMLGKIGRREEGIELLHEIYAEYYDDSYIMGNFYGACLEMKEYGLVEKYADYIIANKPLWYEGYFLKAYSLYEFNDNRDGEALYWLDYGMYIFGGDLDAYFLRIRLLIRNEALDEAEEMVQILENSQLKDNESVIYCRARLLEYQDKDDEAFELMKSIYENREKLGSYFDMQEEYLYRYLVQKEAHTDYGKRKEIEELLTIAEEGLKLRPNHYGTRDYHAFILLRLERTDEALKEYLEMEKFQYHSVEVEERIGSIYYDDLQHFAHKAIEYFMKAKEKGGDKFCGYYIGVSHYYLQQFMEGKKELEEMLEREPGDVDVMRWLAHTYAALTELDKALEMAEKVAEISAKDSRDRSSIYSLTLRMLRRQGRFDEAIEKAKKFKKNGNFEHYYMNECEILLQAGKINEAKKAARKYMKNESEDDVVCAIHTLMCCYIIEDNPKMVKSVFEENQTRFSYMSDSIMQLYLEYFNNIEESIKTMLGRLRRAKKRKDDDFTYYYNNLAEYYYRAGKRKQAKKYAQLAVENVEYILEKNILNATMIHSRKIQPLAVLGRYDDAEAEIEYCKNAPMCLECDECGCRDILVFEAFLEETRGNLERAYELCDIGTKSYPGETDFAIYKKYFAGKIEEQKDKIEEQKGKKE